jgi:hypothetical protein
MKRLLLICALMNPASAFANPVQLQVEECAAVLAALRNHVETIFLVQMAHDRGRVGAGRAEMDEIRSSIEEALAHYDSNASRNGASILGERCGIAASPGEKVN